MLRNSSFYPVLFLLSLASTLGCGAKQPTAYPASGKVLLNGRPASGVELIFVPDNPPESDLLVPTPRAVSDAEGRFEVSTYTGGDGAPADGYSVIAIRMSKLPEGVDPEAFNSVDELKGKYSEPDKSGLRVQIEPRTNELPDIELNR
ncbi:hypothetical protein Pla108_22270 [Botrimarina colliarenosi]|uniref:Carboxypeptidase regulatory-like domain-containing protein n=1 Tax=Botrimarina colliarenosi TaxID=2528001 RepID=A0A5C6AG83_9BACT|nr:hypothetical protein Pla108_22270 [Botrimarina colliarenosi]